ncbi:hypothetical protein YC2023_035170 [Brassica napus]
MSLGGLLFELLSEALGLESETLNRKECLKTLLMVCHYYPPCPKPDLTMGISKHSDNSFLTVLLPDNIGGLQIRHQDSWVEVAPLPGSLVINIGDFVQDQMGYPVPLCNGLYARLLLMGKSNGDQSSREKPPRKKNTVCFR